MPAGGAGGPDGWHQACSSRLARALPEPYHLLVDILPAPTPAALPSKSREACWQRTGHTQPLRILCLFLGIPPACGPWAISTPMGGGPDSRLLLQAPGFSSQPRSGTCLLPPGHSPEDLVQTVHCGALWLSGSGAVVGSAGDLPRVQVRGSSSGTAGSRAHGGACLWLTAQGVMPSPNSRGPRPALNGGVPPLACAP